MPSPLRKISSAPQNKWELYQTIKLAYEKILADYSTIPEEYSRVIGIEIKAEEAAISISDSLAYLTGWGKLVLKWYRRTSHGQPVDFPETGYQWSNVDKLSQDFYCYYKGWKYRDLIDEFKTTIIEVLTLIESLSNQQLYGKNWHKKYTLGKMIQLNTSSLMKSMRTKVRGFKNINNIQ